MANSKSMIRKMHNWTPCGGIATRRPILKATPQTKCELALRAIPQQRERDKALSIADHISLIPNKNPERGGDDNLGKIQKI